MRTQLDLRAEMAIIELRPFPSLIVRGYFFGPNPQPEGHQLALNVNRHSHNPTPLTANRVTRFNQYIQNYPDEELKLRLIADSPIRVWQATRASDGASVVDSAESA
jgi:hypothetical protein